MPTPTREIQLAARPHGLPTAEDFRLVPTELPDPAPGEVLVRNIVMSVDPYMRGRMNDVPSYAPPWKLNETAQGGAVGEVLQSGVAHLEPGTLVVHNSGWREHALVPEQALRVLLPAGGLPPSLYLGILGMPGLTAYTGLLRIARFAPGLRARAGRLMGRGSGLAGRPGGLGGRGGLLRVRTELGQA